MVILPSPSFIAINFSLLLIFLGTCLAQNSAFTSPSVPTIAECGTILLPLASCAPFVQGTVSSPAAACCDGLKQIYAQRPSCLCLVLNDTTLSSFPINRTLALRLPLLCNLQIDISSCSGMPLPPSSPASQISFGTQANSTVTASPMATGTPLPSITGNGFGRNSGSDLKMKEKFVVVTVAILTSYI
ncbi:hypothetical protein NMG60_11024046 [Bertholletia excelsa]